MTSPDTIHGLQLRSLIKRSGELELSLINVPTPEPAADEVIVRIEASPINPSDLRLLIGAADMTTAKAIGTRDNPAVSAVIPERAVPAMGGVSTSRCPSATRARRGQGGVLGGVPGSTRQDRRYDRRCDVRAIPMHQGCRLPRSARRGDGG